MADSKEKQASCPICGATETAMDADALEGAIKEHMQQAHNMTSPVTPESTDLKNTNQRDDSAVPGVPIAPGNTPTILAAPGNNIGNNPI